ncbi:MAG: hypothetical protein KDE22_12565 [Rhodobacterales bacterium]|nr:hypothetical protein [Rhodobacterales bacterium]
MIRSIFAGAALALLLAAAQPAAAADTVTLQDCAQAYGACVNECARNNPSDGKNPNPAAAGCETLCAGKRAACETEAGYDAAKPWVKEKYGQTVDFFKGLLDGK